MSSLENPFLQTLVGPVFVRETFLADEIFDMPRLPKQWRSLIGQVLEIPADKVATCSWLAERIVEEAEEEVALSRAAGEFI